MQPVAIDQWVVPGGMTSTFFQADAAHLVATNMQRGGHLLCALAQCSRWGCEKVFQLGLKTSAAALLRS